MTNFLELRKIFFWMWDRNSTLSLVLAFEGESSIVWGFKLCSSSLRVSHVGHHKDVIVPTTAVKTPKKDDGMTFSWNEVDYFFENLNGKKLKKNAQIL
jgi:hypothetical protein